MTRRLRLRDVIPNRTTQLALIRRVDAPRVPAMMPVRLTQLVGGRTWSLSLVRTEEAVAFPRDVVPLERIFPDQG